jgi:hypothetical protein
VRASRRLSARETIARGGARENGAGRGEGGAPVNQSKHDGLGERRHCSVSIQHRQQLEVVFVKRQS